MRQQYRLPLVVFYERRTPEKKVRVWSRSPDLIDSIGQLLSITVGRNVPAEGIESFLGVYKSSKINMEYGTEARGSILKRCQEPHFNYPIRYSLQIYRACGYGGAPDRLYYGTSIFNMKLQPNDPLVKL